MVLGLNVDGDSVHSFSCGYSVSSAPFIEKIVLFPLAILDSFVII